jgi:hypothetical protein
VLGAQHRLQLAKPEGLAAVLATLHGVNLRERVEMCKAEVGVEAAAALLRSYPCLVVGVHPSDIAPKLDALAVAFRTDRRGALHLCSRVKAAARLLCMQLDNTQQKVEVLCSILQLEPEELFKKCCKYPRVLTVDPGDMRARASALGGGLGLATAKVADLCRQDPSCLAVPPGTVVAAAEAVREALGLPREEAVQLCLSTPAVLHKSASSIAAKAKALKQHLGLQGRDLGKCMVRPHPGCWGVLRVLCGWCRAVWCVTVEWMAILSAVDERVACHGIAWQCVFCAMPCCVYCAHCSMVGANGLEGTAQRPWHAQACSQPLRTWMVASGAQILFSVPASKCAPRLAALPAMLGITQDEALALVLDDPKLLLKRLDTLAAAWRELQLAVGMRPEWREQIGGWAAVTLSRSVRHGWFCCFAVLAAVVIAWPPCVQLVEGG